MHFSFLNRQKPVILDLKHLKRLQREIRENQLALCRLTVVTILLEDFNMKLQSAFAALVLLLQPQQI